MKNKQQQYVKNPFRIQGVIEKFIQTKEKDHNFVEPGTGQLFEVKKISSNKLILHDEKSYTKVFMDTGDVLSKLTPSTIKLYLYTVLQVRINKDSVYINEPDACLWCGSGRSTFHKCINELIDIGILARKLGSYLEFWINPNFLYNGDRTKLFRFNKQSIHNEGIS
jgi:hypothetical protein